MLQNIEECQEVHKNIIEKAKNIIELKEKRQGLEDETHKMFSELQHLTSDSSVFEANQENLLKRNKLIRDKCNNIEVDVKEESAKISECKKSFFKKLGLQLSMDLSPLSDNFVELKIQFSESHDYYATFVYDTVTEDYDLTSLQPLHPRFSELRNFLQETKDIQGFLFNFRNSMLKSIATKN